MSPGGASIISFVKTSIITDPHVCGIGRVENDFVIVNMHVERHPFPRCAFVGGTHYRHFDIPNGVRAVRVNENLSVILRISARVVAHAGP